MSVGSDQHRPAGHGVIRVIGFVLIVVAAADSTRR
jgi:hypothetical protein